MIIIWLKQLLKKPRYFFVTYRTANLAGHINIKLGDGIFDSKEILRLINEEDAVLTSVFEITKKEYKKGDI